MTEENTVEPLETEVLQQDTQQQESVVQEEAQEQPKNDAEINWRKANEVMRSQKEQIEELRRMVEERNKPAPVEEKDEFSDLDPDDFLTVSKARAFAEKLAEKKAYEAAKKMVGQYAQQQSIAQAEIDCRSKYEDYDYVVENFAVPLIKNDPALAYKIQQSKNPAETAYKLGKLSDQYEESGMTQKTSPKAEKILKNAARPQSVNAAPSSIKAQADQFSKMSPSEIWAQSQKYAKQA
jgi:hypothetical protein